MNNFADDKYYEGKEDGFGICQRIEHPEAIRDALKISDGYKNLSWDMRNKALMATLKLNKAYVVDPSDYVAHLYTTADFGCVGFEQK